EQPQNVFLATDIGLNGKSLAAEEPDFIDNSVRPGVIARVIHRNVVTAGCNAFRDSRADSPASAGNNRDCHRSRGYVDLRSGLNPQARVLLFYFHYLAALKSHERHLAGRLAENPVFQIDPVLRLTVLAIRIAQRKPNLIAIHALQSASFGDGLLRLR